MGMGWWQAEFSSWSAVRDAAALALVDRRAKMEAAAAQVEHKMQLLGVTGIEDRLQVVLTQRTGVGQGNGASAGGEACRWSDRPLGSLRIQCLKYGAGGSA